MALDFPASSASPFTAPNGVIYTWNAAGYWEAKTDPSDYLKLDASNGPVTGELELSAGFKSTGTGADRLQSGTIAQRPSGFGTGDAGYTRFNTDSNGLEEWTGTEWTVPFSIQDGSFTKNIITWNNTGGVEAWSTTDTGGDTGDTMNRTYTSQPTTVLTGGGNGALTVSFTKEKYAGGILNVSVNNPGSGYSVGDTFTTVVPVTGVTITCTVGQVSSVAESGWYAEPGTDYFVSATQSSTYSGRPTFSPGVQLGNHTTPTEPFTVDQLSEGALFIQPVTGKVIANQYSRADNANAWKFYAGSYTNFTAYDGSDPSTTSAACQIRMTPGGAIQLKGGMTTSLIAQSDGLLQSVPTFDNTSSNTSNGVRMGSSGVFQRVTSSRRYKDNIRDCMVIGSGSSLELVSQIQPRMWEDYRTGDTVCGFIAEELYELGGSHLVSYSPWSRTKEVVIGEDENGEEITETQRYYPLVGNGSTPVTKDGGPLTDDSEVVDGLDERGLTITLVRALQEANAKIDDLESRLSALES